MICIFQAELGKPSPSQADKGRVNIYVDCSPTAAPMFEVAHFDFCHSPSWWLGHQNILVLHNQTLSCNCVSFYDFTMKKPFENTSDTKREEIIRCLYLFICYFYLESIFCDFLCECSSILSVVGSMHVNNNKKGLCGCFVLSYYSDFINLHVSMV